MSDGIPDFATELDDAALEGGAAEAGGWEGLAEWTGDLAPEGVEALVAVRELEAVYPLLHSLVGRSPRQFFVWIQLKSW